MKKLLSQKLLGMTVVAGALLVAVSIALSGCGDSTKAKVENELKGSGWMLNIKNAGVALTFNEDNTVGFSVVLVDVDTVDLDSEVISSDMYPYVVKDSQIEILNSTGTETFNTFPYEYINGKLYIYSSEDKKLRFDKLTDDWKSEAKGLLGITD